MVVAAPRLEGPEHRAHGGDADVAGERLLETAGERPAVDGPDDRLGDPVQAAGEAAEAQLHDLADPPGRGVPHDRRDVGLEVGAGAERVAGAGQDGHVDGVVVAKVRPGPDEQVLGVRVDRVAGLGPVQGDVGDPVALLVEHLRHPGLLRS